MQATRDASLNLQSNQAGDWAGMGTWEEPLQEIWQPFIADGIRAFVANFNTTAQCTFNTNQIAKTSLNISGAMTFVMDTSRIRNSTATFNSTSAFTSSVTQTHRNTLNVNSNSAFTAESLTLQLITLNLNSNITIAANALRVQPITSTMVSAAQITLNSIAQIQKTFQAQCTFTSAPIIGQVVELDIQSVSNIVFNPNHIERTNLLAATITTFTNFTNHINRVTLSVQGFATTFVVGEKYIIDPERIFTVLNESRQLQIMPETRLFELNNETRINMLEQELRSFLISSETRNLVVQHNLLVDVAGTPRDRREG